MGDIWSWLSGVMGALRNTADFLGDPLGYIFKALVAANSAIVSDLLPALSKAALPDFSLGWFIDAYRTSFALAFIVWGLIQIVNLYQVSKGRISGSEFLDMFMQRSGLFLAGAAFGPAVGIILVEGARLLTDSLVKRGISASMDKFTVIMTAVLKVSPDLVFGGVLLGIGVMLFLLLGLLLMVFILALMLVTMYFSGVVFPLGWVWYTSSTREGFAKKIPMVLVCILLAHPLIFFYLGVAFNMLSVIGTGFADGAKWFMTSLAAIAAFFMTLLTPMLVLKFADVSPGMDHSAAGPSPSMPGIPQGTGGGGGGGSGGGGGPSSVQDANDQALSEPSSSDAGSTTQPAAVYDGDERPSSRGQESELNDHGSAGSDAGGTDLGTEAAGAGDSGKEAASKAGAEGTETAGAESTGAEAGASSAGAASSSGAAGGAAGAGAAAGTGGVSVAVMAAAQAAKAGVDVAQQAAGETAGAMDSVEE